MSIVVRAIVRFFVLSLLFRRSRLLGAAVAAVLFINRKLGEPRAARRASRRQREPDRSGPQEDAPVGA